MTAEEANEQLTSDLRTIVREAEDLLTATGSQTGDHVSGIRSRLTTALATARATTRKAQEKAVAAAKATDHVIREHPYESIGVAFGLGLLVGVLVARK